MKTASTVSLGRRLFVIMAGALIAAGGITYALLDYAQERIIEHQAVTLAESVARLATIARTAYTREVAEKLARDGFGPHSDYRDRAGFVPLPSQFLKLVGEAASRDSEELYRYRPLSKWNLGPGQGLQSAFHSWAWGQLEAQDLHTPNTAIDWRPVWRFEDDQGVRVLHYMRADPASASSCVSCHNAFERRADIQALRVAAGVETGKQWNLHQLMGAIEVTIPLQKVQAVAAAQTRLITAWIVAAVMLGLSISTWFLVRDVGHLRRVQQLSWQATHDPLTGLANRRGFESELDRLLQGNAIAARRHGLCLMDLDHFKEINDTHGHEAGDEVLKQIADVLQNLVRTNDTVARLGGDEFAVLLVGCDLSQAGTIAENLRHTIANTDLRWRGLRLSTTVSVGLVMLDTGNVNASEVMRAADKACYEAKHTGRNRVIAIR